MPACRACFGTAASISAATCCIAWCLILSSSCSALDERGGLGCCVPAVHAVSLQEATCNQHRLLQAWVQRPDCSCPISSVQHHVHLQQEHTVGDVGMQQSMCRLQSCIPCPQLSCAWLQLKYDERDEQLEVQDVLKAGDSDDSDLSEEDMEEVDSGRSSEEDSEEDSETDGED